MGEIPFFLPGKVANWEIVICEYVHLGCCPLGYCHLGSCPWVNAFRKVPNIVIKVPFPQFLADKINSLKSISLKVVVCYVS